MKLRAFGSHILIKTVEIPKDPNAIEVAKAIPDELCYGEIVNHGSDLWDYFLSPAGDKPVLSEGCKVLIAKDAGEEVEFEGQKFKVIMPNHILCVCSDE